MNFHKKHQPARTIYRIDRTMTNGETYEWYGSEIYGSRKKAEVAVARRFSKYLNQISIVEVHEDASDVLVSDSFRL